MSKRANTRVEHFTPNRFLSRTEVDRKFFANSVPLKFDAAAAAWYPVFATHFI